MKSIVLFALVAFVAAGPAQRTVVVTTPEKVIVINEKPVQPNLQGQYQGQSLRQYGFLGQHTGPQGNLFEVAQYIAYQFQKIQQLGYTGVQISQYFLEQGFPEFVVEYFVQQYEAGLTQTYFQSPYQIFQFYLHNGVSQEVEQYIFQQISQVYQQYQKNLVEYGQEAFQQNYLNVPHSIVQYVLQSVKYYKQNGVSYSQAQMAFQQLQQAQQYAEKALEFFTNGSVQKEGYQYIFEQLQQVVQYIQQIQTLPLEYQTYQQYIPYYAAQYYSQKFQLAYQYFQNVYQYIQQKQGLILPEDFLQKVNFAYQAAQKAYQVYQPSQYRQLFNGENIPSYRQGYSSNYYEASQYYKQVLQNIQSVQQYIQSQENFPQSNYISQQLTLAYQAYQSLSQLSQKNYFSQPIVNYFKKQLQEARQYLINAFVLAEQQGQQYIVQQLQNALEYTQKLQLVAQYYSGYKYSYGQTYQHGSNYTYPLSQVYQYGQNIFQYIQQQVVRGNIPQEYADYIFQQLKQVEEYVKYFHASGYQNSYGYQYPVQQVQQYFQNIYEYIQQQANIPQYIVQYVSQQTEFALQAVQYFKQGQYQNQFYPSQEKFFQGMNFNKNQEYPTYQGHFQYKPYQQSQYFNQVYPTQGKNYFQDMVQSYLNKNQEHPIYQGQYQYTPNSQSYGYYGPYGSYQFRPSSQQYTSESSVPYGYNTYQTGSQFINYPYQYGFYNHHSQIAASAA